MRPLPFWRFSPVSPDTDTINFVSLSAETGVYTASGIEYIQPVPILAVYEVIVGARVEEDYSTTSTRLSSDICKDVGAV
jgi:hypothetical protein